MTALPVVRITVVDHSRITSSTDPKTASFALYSFLKTVPTRASCHDAFTDLKRHVQSTSGEGYSNSFIRSNASQQRFLNAIESAAFDVFGRPPQRVFRVPQGADEADIRRRAVEAFLRREVPTAPSTRSDPISTSRVVSPPSSYRPVVAEEPPAPAPISITGSGVTSGQSTALYRVIEAVQEQSGGGDDKARSRVRSGQTTNAGIDILTRLQQLLESEEFTGSDLGIAAAGLQKRIHAALLFQKLKEHEQETLQLAHMALHTEVAALSQVLRDVSKCVVRSEVRLTGEDGTLPFADPAYVSEHRLFEDVQDLLTQR